MTTTRRTVVAAIALGFLAACASSSDQSSSATRACWPKTFRCDGGTPGFWSNNNGCALLEDGGFAIVNGILAPLNRSVGDCDDMDDLLKVDAVPMFDKLLAMWIAFSLNNWNEWEGDCPGGANTDFAWDPSMWIPQDADAACEAAVEAWFADSRIEFGELETLVETLLVPGGDACQQEALKDFLDAANNEDSLCICDCVTGATGSTGGTGGYGD